MNKDLENIAEEMAAMGLFVAHFSLCAAYFTDKYKEPEISSIDEWDEMHGTADVADPLLTTHRLMKFYLISSGDALLAASNSLAAPRQPLHIGVASAARTSMEHASRSLYLSDSSVNVEERVSRAGLLIQQGLNDYREDMEHERGVKAPADSWANWKRDTKSQLNNLRKKYVKYVKRKNCNEMVEMYHSDAKSYRDLSRAVHGNAIWIIGMVLQEQKGTNYPLYQTLKNFLPALKMCKQAAENLCCLWRIESEAVVRKLQAKNTSLNFVDSYEELNMVIDRLDEKLKYLAEFVYVDTSPDEQPSR